MRFNEWVNRGFDLFAHFYVLLTAMGMGDDSVEGIGAYAAVENAGKTIYELKDVDIYE
jgi:hypothetical protein